MTTSGCQAGDQKNTWLLKPAIDIKGTIMRLTQLMARHGTPPPVTIAKQQIRLASLLAITFIMLFAGRAHAFSQIVAFGDSLTDNGNLFALTGQPPAPYFSGRFSNGPVWVETLAGSLGITLDDRAVGGALTGTGHEAGLIGLGMTNQFNQYISEGPADPNALYVIWGGANDFLNLTTDPATAVGIAVSNLVNGVTNLMAAGAQHFLVPNLPDLGLTPRSLISPDGGSGATIISSIFNGSLAFNMGLVGADITILDTFTLLQDVVANPAGFGLTNVTEPCFDAAALPSATLCANPDQYAFWDDIHPTNTLHNQLAAEALLAVAPVPVPAAVWLFGSALGLLGWMRRKTA